MDRGRQSQRPALDRRDGTSQAIPLTTSSTVQIPWSFSPDGTRLAFRELSPGRDSTCGQSRSGGPSVAPSPVSPSCSCARRLMRPIRRFRPDGRWIAYGSGAYGRWDVYVRPFPDVGGGEVRVSEPGGRIPFWMPNGRELLYRTDDHRLMVVSVFGERGLIRRRATAAVDDAHLWRHRSDLQFRCRSDHRARTALLPAAGTASSRAPTT